MMDTLPKDPAMLLSVINTKLRDFYPSLDELCAQMDVDKQALEDRLASIAYEYDTDTNQFV